MTPPEGTTRAHPRRFRGRCSPSGPSRARPLLGAGGSRGQGGGCSAAHLPGGLPRAPAPAPTPPRVGSMAPPPSLGSTPEPWLRGRAEFQGPWAGGRHPRSHAERGPGPQEGAVQRPERWSVSDPPDVGRGMNSVGPTDTSVVSSAGPPHGAQCSPTAAWGREALLVSAFSQPGKLRPRQGSRPGLSRADLHQAGPVRVPGWQLRSDLSLLRVLLPLCRQSPPIPQTSHPVDTHPWDVAPEQGWQVLGRRGPSLAGVTH